MANADSAATLIADGRIIAAAQEERFTRKKQDARICLTEFTWLDLKPGQALLPEK